jgi:D-3-phosphoglycerate dehydrogenase
MKVLYIQPIHESGMNKLSLKYDVIVAPDDSRATLEKYISDADAVVTRLTTVDAQLMGKAPGLKAVCKHGVGVDNIDVDYAKKHGIAVLTTGDANSSTVAEHAMFAIGAMYKKIIYFDNEMRKNNWKVRDIGNASDVRGKTLGIIGFGRIGMCLAKMAKHGFDMNVFIFDPFVAPNKVEEMGCSYFENLDEMIPLIDIVSPHVPLSESTHNMLDMRRLSMMKKGSYVVNFSRGGIVNEQALNALLENGHIAGAVLDVFESEPPDINSPLLKHANVILSPHCATFTEDSRIRMSMRLSEEIEKILG